MHAKASLKTLVRLRIPGFPWPHLSRQGATRAQLAPLASCRVTLFCGGRGSNTILTELVRHSGIHVTLLVNGYDDGKSTGELRRFLPGMLGPSDFRKNLAFLAGADPTERTALGRILDYRIPNGEPAAIEDALRSLAKSDKQPNVLQELSEALISLRVRRRLALAGYLKAFLDYCDRRQEMPALNDCAFGNLLFAGAYLSSNRNFNTAVRVLTDVCDARAELMNVTRGEARVLTALKADGEVLHSEASIVGPQSRSPILDLFLLPRELTVAERRRLATLKTADKRKFLKSSEEEVQLSPEACGALRNADFIVYGPGTQFSSLFPSYRTRGLARAIATSRACAKVFIANLQSDHDTQDLSIVSLIDRALEYLQDPQNDSRTITHLFYNIPDAEPAPLGSEGRTQAFHKNIRLIHGKFRAANAPEVHCGRAVVKELLGLKDFEARAKSNCG